MILRNLRRYSNRWTVENPVLEDGVMGIEIDTGRFKVGNGITAWGLLPYALSGVLSQIGTSVENYLIAHPPVGGLTINQIKADSDISDSLSKKHSNSLDHATGSDNQDLSNLVVKVSGSSLVPDTEISKIHSAGSDNQDLSGLQLKETGKGLYPDTDSLKLAGIEAGANNYTHPANHAASVITQDVSNRLVTDTEKLTWNGKSDAHSHPYESANANIQTHVGSAHAPSNAQKNSDITKGEIEAKLTGELTSHTHAGSTPIGYTINVQALTSSPTDSQTVYFGMLPKAPTTSANISKIYIRKAGTIKIAEIYCYSGTAGTNEAWSLYIRKNNSADTLIATLSVNTSERVFSNASLNIAVAVGDYIEIKGVQPLWATNPLTCIYGGYIYIE